MSALPPKADRFCSILAQDQSSKSTGSGHDPISLYHHMLIWFRVVAHSLHPAARSHVNGSLNNFTDNFTESESTMLQADITILKKRQKALEKEIGEALTHAPIDDPMVADLKSRILYVKDEIDRLRHEAFVLYH